MSRPPIPRIEAVMTSLPLSIGLDARVVEPDARLDAVVAEMARRRIGSALVARRGRLLGILTATDACRLLADALNGRALRPPDGLGA